MQQRGRAALASPSETRSAAPRPRAWRRSGRTAALARSSSTVSAHVAAAGTAAGRRARNFGSRARRPTTQPEHAALAAAVWTAAVGSSACGEKSSATARAEWPRGVDSVAPTSVAPTSSPSPAEVARELVIAAPAELNLLPLGAPASLRAAFGPTGASSHPNGRRREENKQPPLSGVKIDRPTSSSR